MRIISTKQGKKKVRIRGWVHDLKDLGGIKFIQLRSSSELTQVTITKKEPKLFDKVSSITKESLIKVRGVLKKSPSGGLEITPEKLTIISPSKKGLPIPVSKGTLEVGQEKRFKWRCLDLRKPRQQCIFKVQSALIEGMSSYLLRKGYAQVFTPCLIGVASESGSEVFPVIYFDKEAFLRQDPQLHRQLTICGGFTKIFEVGPAWRAEQSHTIKHLCEHRVCAVELAFIKDEQDIMSVEEEVIIAGLKMVKKKCKKELKILGVELKTPEKPFPVIEFQEVIRVLKKRGKRLSEKEDLDAEAEKMLSEYVLKKHGAEFYFITGFPSVIKPFYVMSRDKAPRWSRSVDLYFRELELSSGGQREHRYDKLMKSVKDKKLSLSGIEWFTEFFKYGAPPHGGFAIGVERLTQAVLGIKQIRDCVLFPRDPEVLVP